MERRKVAIQLLVEYFNNFENPTLEDFVKRNKTRLGGAYNNVRQYWTGLYKKLATDLECPQSCRFLEQMRESHRKMKDKWVLPSGVVVEDKMVEYCSTLDYEHAGHSFILDTNDSCWEDVFGDEDIEFIKTHSLPKMATVKDENVISYIRSFKDMVQVSFCYGFQTQVFFIVGSNDSASSFSWIYSFGVFYCIQKSYNEIMMHLTRHAPFTPEENYDVTWLRQSIMNLASDYRSNFFIKAGILIRTEEPEPNRNRTEKSRDGSMEGTDRNRHYNLIENVRLWFCINKYKLFRNKKQEALATSEGKNLNRVLKERKLHGTRVDLRLVYDGVEIACGEASLYNESEKGTKEMKKSQLKCSENLRDMLVNLVKRYTDKKQDMMTIGFILMGFSLSLLFMDCPGGSVCRLTRLKRYHITTDIDAFTENVLSILEILLQVKHTMLHVIEAARSSRPPPADLASANNKLYIPYSVSPSSSSSSKSSTSASASSGTRTSSSTCSGKPKKQRTT
ncbi:hypothetical protein BDC45DRAFT_532953 [Circinella umbellata]|nr:hypothetical protein BDC45DRAFT_532953 [Circinella umbellata]